MQCTGPVMMHTTRPRGSFFVRCGQCTSCRLERSRQWAVRVVHEASLYRASSFVTLTYDEQHLKSPSLDYADFQLFNRRARRKLGPFRFFMAGEYGTQNWRPHFHTAMFGIHFGDRYPWRKSPAGFQLYRSPTLESLWPNGGCEIGDVSFESAAYIARYVCKKVTGDDAKPIQDDGTPGHYVDFDPVTGEWQDLKPEFMRCSLKPGIGAEWFDRYRSEVFPRDELRVRGSAQRPPRYYMKRLTKVLPLMAAKVRQDRMVLADELVRAEGPSLQSRDIVAKARLNSRGRKL